jgi:hypothetical protein
MPIAVGSRVVRTVVTTERLVAVTLRASRAAVYHGTAENF